MATSDLAVEACTKVLKKTGVAPEDVDLVIIATATGDFWVPLRCLHRAGQDRRKERRGDGPRGRLHRLHLPLETARNFIQGGGARNVLVAGAEILSRVIDWKDRNTCFSSVMAQGQCSFRRMPPRATAASSIRS